MMDSLPQFGLPHPGFATELEFVRALEEYEGPILTEYAGEWGARYVEKWCTQTPDGRVFRSLLVRTDLRSIEFYLHGRIDLRTLLEERSDGFGFLVDQTLDEAQPTMSLVTLSSLPPNYLGAPATFHDPTLRPREQRTRQLFLLDPGWSGEQIGRIERAYLDAAAFNYFAARVSPGTMAPSFPDAPLKYKYRRGFPVAKAFASLRKEQPKKARGKPAFVQAASPGILAIEVDTVTAENLRNSVAIVAETAPLYENVQTWASQDIDGSYAIPADASQDLQRLAAALSLDLSRFAGDEPGDESERILTLGKLLTAYFRKLSTLASPKHAAFLGRR